MGFADRYLHSANSSDLRDDEHHHATDALCAAALADAAGAGLGALLTRVKYADGTQTKLFESGTANLAQLLRIWTLRVIEKGRERKWVREGTAWDMQAAQALYHRVAERSLAYWLDGKCAACSGSGNTADRRILRSLQRNRPGRDWWRRVGARESARHGERTGRYAPVTQCASCQCFAQSQIISLGQAVRN